MCCRLFPPVRVYMARRPRLVHLIKLLCIAVHLSLLVVCVLAAQHVQPRRLPRVERMLRIHTRRLLSTWHSGAKGLARTRLLHMCSLLCCTVHLTLLVPRVPAVPYMHTRRLLRVQIMIRVHALLSNHAWQPAATGVACNRLLQQVWCQWVAPVVLFRMTLVHIRLWLFREYSSMVWSISSSSSVRSSLSRCSWLGRTWPPIVAVAMHAPCACICWRMYTYPRGASRIRYTGARIRYTSLFGGWVSRRARLACARRWCHASLPHSMPPPHSAALRRRCLPVPACYPPFIGPPPL